MQEQNLTEQDSPRPSGLLGRCLDVPPEEVRFAVVLNGGVSLAVWMGGVVVELDRLTKARRRQGTDPYAVLKQLTGCDARADVITGTSAGGINGAALALAQVNRTADPRVLRDLWIEQGRIETLLRAPFQGQPTSLLKGDEYFLPKLNAALELLAEKQERWWTPREAPIDLSITTTVLRGNQAVSVDSMGHQLPQSLHAARFQWQRHANTREEQDPFAKDQIKRTAHRLALASRSSASFPLAFEPSFVPVGSPAHREPRNPNDLTEEQRLRPDMAGLVKGWGSGARTKDRSRFCVDGGALANTPTMAALEAIESMPAEGPVRRVMLLVFPHAPAVGLDPPDSQAEAPSFVGSLTGVLGALTAQGSRSYVEALEHHNLVAAGRRGTRADLLVELGTEAKLFALTESIYPQYRRLRRWRAGRDLAAWRTGVGSSNDIAYEELPLGWSFERVRSAAQQAQDTWADSPPDGATKLPYAPEELPTADMLEAEPDTWGWGVTAALGVAEAIADLMRRLVFNLRPEQEFDTVTEARSRVLTLAEELRDCRELTDGCWRESEVLLGLPPDENYWTLRLACYDHLMLGKVTRATIEDSVGRVIPPGVVGSARTEQHRAILDALKPTLMWERRPDGTESEDAGWVGRQVRQRVDALVAQLRLVLPVLARHREHLARLDPTLPHWEHVLAPEQDLPAVSDGTLLSRLLLLEIAATTLGDEVTTGSSFPVDLVQVSAQTDNPFATYTRSAEEKLGGDAINRFGGFLKRSWRVNDWIWGRADGATMLCRTMLDPERIRRTAVLSRYIDEIAPQPVPGQQPQAPEAVARAKAADTVREVVEELGLAGVAPVESLAASAVEELAPVLRSRQPGEAIVLPSSLESLAKIFAWAIHLEVVPQELPALAGAIAADRVDGANTRSRGEVFVQEHAALLRRLDAAASAGVPPEPGDRLRALEVFDRAGIGWEPLREESSSDLVIRTAASAAAVMATVADSDRSGLGGAKPVTRAFRGAMLLPYWAVFGLTSRQTLARGLALLAFALGGVALALALFGVLSPTVQPIATALGTGAVLGGFAYGALRTGSLLHGIVLLTPLIPLVAYAQTRNDDAEGVSTLVIVLAFAVGMMLLGSIGVASGSVWAALDQLGDRQGLVRPRPPTSSSNAARRGYEARLLARRLLAVVRALASLALLALAAAAVAAAVWYLLDQDRLDFVHRHQVALGIGAVVVALVCALVAHLRGLALQVLTRRGGRSLEYAALAHPGATAAGWSVVYGMAYLAVAWLVSLDLLTDGNPYWQRIAFATAVVMAVILILVLPWLLPVLALAEVARAEVGRARVLDPGRAPEPDASGDRLAVFAQELLVRGTSYRRFVAKRETEPVLTEHGRQLEQRVSDARAASSLATMWQAPAVPTPSDVLDLGEVLDRWCRAWQERLTPRAQKRLRELLDKLELAPELPEGALSGEEPQDWQSYAADVRHAFDRLLAALGRDPRRRSRVRRAWRKLRNKD